MITSFTDTNGNSVHFSTNLNTFSTSPGHVLVLLYSSNGWVFTKHKKRGLEFPGGKKELGETIEQAAKREVWEETGAHIKDLIYIGQYKVEGMEESFVKNVYFARVDCFESKNNYLETDGAFFIKELPDTFSDKTFSFIMRDQVVVLSLKRLKELQIVHNDSCIQ
ncbi:MULTISPECIES: RNA deprotection pyrophosphohydrolase [Bacillus]|uniref:RNA deprotection pyrophosphohydrolase n=1 Tax=Bacillus TaxID=1386 RepID=UPI00030B6B32|nr:MULTISPECIES: nucleoside triphosphatase YtkD [Bacillus]